MKSSRLLFAMALGLTLTTSSVSANEAGNNFQVSPETPTITANELLPSNYSAPSKSYDSYEAVVSEFGSDITPITPEEIEKAEKIGYVEVNSPDELAALLEYDKAETAKREESNSLLEQKMNLASSNETSYRPNNVSPFASRESLSQEYQLDWWGNPFTGLSYLYGRTQIYYWSDTKKIDETNASSYMVGDISGHEWVPSTPEIVADGYYHRYVRYLGDLKKFIIVNGKPSYTTTTRIDQLTQIYSTSVIG